MLSLTLKATPAVPAIDPDAAEKAALVVPSVTLTSEMPVVGLLVTVAEPSGRSIVALVTSTTGPPVDCSAATPAATVTRVPVPAAVFTAPVPVIRSPLPLPEKISRSVNARSPLTFVSTTPAPPTGFTESPTAVVPPATWV